MTTGDALPSWRAGAEQALQQADSNGWTVVSINRDWETVF
jgi:hypothetical protein